LIAAAACVFASDPVAARLAREAHQAQLDNQIVRAWLLYSEAAARDPSNPSYRANRDSLAPAAHLLSQADIETANVSADIKAAEKDAAAQTRDAHSSNAEPPIEFASEKEWNRDPGLQPLPRVQPTASPGTFNLTGDTKRLFEQVTAAFGVRVIFDPELQPERNIRFEIDHADFRTVLEGLTAVTHTFVYPVSPHEIVVAQDTEPKRDELEPIVLLTFPLPDARDQKDLIEAANAVRGILNLRTIGWDSESRTVMVRDRATRARVARSLLEALLLPRAQVSLELQFLTIDTDKTYHYGASLPTSFQLIDFGHIGGFQNILQSASTAANFLAFGGGATLFGFGISDATFFATYSNSYTSVFYDATVVVADGQTANFHVGDKYPIPQSLYTGAQLSTPSIYNPVGQFTQEDLGLLLKLTPRFHGDGDMSIDVEADFKSLGTQTIDTVPEVNEREFKGAVTLREGQLAVLAGMDTSSDSRAKNGLAGVSSIPGLDQILAENTREKQTSRTLIVLKPTITRLPLSPTVSPQFLLGPQRGERVVL